MGLLRAVVRAKKPIVGLDLCEVAPGATEWDANVGARILYKMIGFALMTQVSVLEFSARQKLTTEAQRSHGGHRGFIAQSPLCSLWISVPLW